MMDEKQMREYVMDCLKAGSIKMLSVDARGDKVGVSVDIEVPFGECEEALAEAGMKGAHVGGILAKVVADSKKFDDAMMRLHAILNEPHTCPICDGYGYLVRITNDGRYWHSERSPENVSLEMCGHTDIPCPDCNE